MLNEQEIAYLMAILKTPGIGPVLAKNLVAYCSGPAEVFGRPKGFLKQIPEIGDRAANLLQKKPDLAPFQKEIQTCIDHGIDIITYLDAAYPEYLKTIHNAPLLLFKKGKLDFNAHPAIALVGTRMPSDYGKKVTESFAKFFAEKGINIVSGLAYGIDICAHNAVLEVEGITTAVLGHGFGTIYPALHKPVAEKIIREGALLTEFALNVKPDAKNFPFRNRIIAGMCKATIVIESAAKGGATMTARLAFEQNREVFAVPGNIDRQTSEGCNILIRDNIAKLVTKPLEVLTDLDLENFLPSFKEDDFTKSNKFQAFKVINEPLSSDEQIILNALIDGKPQLIDELLFSTQLSISSLNANLLGLEFKGYVKQMPGRKFIRI